MLKTIIVAALLSSVGLSAWADGATCASQAGDKKLAGAAKTSFVKKCEADATKTCTATATDKKLAGAARASFVKKCASDAAG